MEHKPIIYVDYEAQDKTGDAKILSIGKAQWCKHYNSIDFSAKVWRWPEEGERWSPQSEELPLWRVLDLARLVLAVIKGKESGLREEMIEHNEDNRDDKEKLISFIQRNHQLYEPRINALRELLEM